MKRMTLDKALRQAVRSCGKTPYRVAKDAAIEPDLVTRFLHGRDIRISTAAKICLALDLELTKRK